MEVPGSPDGGALSPRAVGSYIGREKAIYSALVSTALAVFSEATQRWFADHFREPTDVQREGWARIAAGEHTLMLAPTGSGKTLAAFLFCLDRLARASSAGDTRSAGPLHLADQSARLRYRAQPPGAARRHRSGRRGRRPPLPRARRRRSHRRYADQDAPAPGATAGARFSSPRRNLSIFSLVPTRAKPCGASRLSSSTKSTRSRAANAGSTSRSRSRDWPRRRAPTRSASASRQPSARSKRSRSFSAATVRWRSSTPRDLPRSISK